MVIMYISTYQDWVNYLFWQPNEQNNELNQINILPTLKRSVVSGRYMITLITLICRELNIMLIWYQIR